MGEQCVMAARTVHSRNDSSPFDALDVSGEVAAQIAKVCEYEGLVRIKAASDDVFDVLMCQPLSLFQVKVSVATGP